MEVKREESAIDLLSLQKDTLEAQRRSGVDEQLWLFVLRACMSDASSSSMAVVVGLTSGVDVLMESQTLSTTQPASEESLEVSFSAPATTPTTINVSGDKKASTPYTDSVA
ncbi:hypothetical protein MTR67_001553 [Solanum verrucosum]|uniref:Uncharacterized protein n=1 Tax=Solanum verrucosum TaxID=315347 RepID=A0AAF0T8J0_SOLVR|nr:hypothetical protein MTR67_001553 [Solanum verrucosum]